MKEYRLHAMPDALRETLAGMGIDVIEESFAGQTTYSVYAGTDIEAFLRNGSAGDVSVMDIADTGWEDEWKKHLKGGWLTDTIRFDFEPRPDITEPFIRITPAMAFGTGTHPTTRIAARLMEPVVKHAVVADIGTGTGILAMAAMRSGARRVYAFDNDPVALKNTVVNIRDNGFADIHAWAGETDSFARSIAVDVVIANIITSVLKRIHEDVMARTPEYVVYSGITDAEADGFINDLPLSGYRVARRESMDGWTGVLIERVP